MSIRVMTRVWDEGPDQQGELLVLLALADFANDEGVAWPSMETIASRARMEVRSTRRVIRRLEEKGWLTVKEGGGRGRGQGRASVYRIADAAPNQSCRDNDGPPDEGSVAEALPGQSVPVNEGVNPDPSVPVKDALYPDPSVPLPGPVGPLTRTRRSPQPSRTKKDPSVRTETRSAEGGLSATARFYAERISAGDYVPPSALKECLVGVMLREGLVTTQQLRGIGVDV